MGGEAAAAPEGAATPIFIVGLPRSGTTLVERMLGRHPQVTACGELNEFAMAYRWAADDFSAEILDARGASRMAAVDAAAIGKSYLHATGWRRGDKAFFTDKHQSNFLFAGLILRALPWAKIIHVERDAMDACFSNLKEVYTPLAYTHSYGLADMAHHHRNYRNLMAHLDEVAPGRILRVRYEDLVADPQAQVARMLDYCGLPADASLTDIASNQDPVSTASSVQVREGVHSRSVGGWRRYAGPLAPMEALLRPE